MLALPNVSNNSSPEEDSTDVMFIFADFVSPILTVLFCSIGIFGNYQVISFYRAKTNKTPSEYIILNLASVDLVYCMLTLTFVLSLRVMQPDYGQLVERALLLVSTLWAIPQSVFTFITTYSFICIFVITVNRYFAVCQSQAYRLTHPTAFPSSSIKTFIISLFVHLHSSHQLLTSGGDLLVAGAKLLSVFYLCTYTHTNFFLFFSFAQGILSD